MRTVAIPRLQGKKGFQRQNLHLIRPAPICQCFSTAGFEKLAPCHQQSLEACKTFRPHMPSMWISQLLLTILSWNIPHKGGLASVFPSCSMVLKDGFLSSSASPTNCLATRISSHCKVMHTQDHWKNHEPLRPLLCGFSSQRLQLGLRA